MKSGFYAAVSAIALLSSGAVQAQNNTASIKQSAASSQNTATITQSGQITSSSATIVQDAAGSGNDRATATITQGFENDNSASNIATVEQNSVTNGADIELFQAGTLGGTNIVHVLQNGLVGGDTDINQFAVDAGTNRIAEVNQNGVYFVGFEQGGTNTTALMVQLTTGATNIIAGVVQSGVGTKFTVNQGDSINSGGQNLVTVVTASGNLDVRQNSANSGSNTLRNFSGGGLNSTLTQNASDSGTNNIGTIYTNLNISNNYFAINQSAYGTGVNTIGGVAPFNVTGGDVAITQVSGGANYTVELNNISAGTLTINQEDQSSGQGTVAVTAFSGGTARITQRAAWNGGLNSIAVESVEITPSNLAIEQNGADNSISVVRNNGSMSNNIADDGSSGYYQDLSLSTLTIEQNGTFNKAYLNQSTADNLGRISQNGTGNTATINQTTFSGNTAFIVQLGSNSTATIKQ